MVRAEEQSVNTEHQNGYDEATYRFHNHVMNVQICDYIFIIWQWNQREEESPFQRNREIKVSINSI